MRENWAYQEVCPLNLHLIPHRVNGWKDSPHNLQYEEILQRSPWNPRFLTFINLALTCFRDDQSQGFHVYRSLCCVLYSQHMERRPIISSMTYDEILQRKSPFPKLPIIWHFCFWNDHSQRFNVEICTDWYHVRYWVNSWKDRPHRPHNLQYQ